MNPIRYQGDDELALRLHGAPDAEYINRVLNRLVIKIDNRKPNIQRHCDYVRGTRGELRFVSNEFRRYIAERFKGFKDNWCFPVAQAPVERISFKGFTPYGDDAPIDRRVWDIWNRSDADRGISEAALMMTSASRSFALATLMPNGHARISFENPDSCAMLYDALTGQATAALAIVQDDESEFGTLWLPDWVFAVRRTRIGADDERTRAEPNVAGWEFVPESAQRNPLGEIPMVEMRNQCMLDNLPMSDTAMVEDMQDTINVVWAYLLNGLDYATLPARLLLGGDTLEEPVFDDKTHEIIGTKPIELDKQVTERILHIPGEGVTATEFSAANLQGFIPVIEKAVEHIAAETRTPGHYLLTNADVPATGYEVAEAGLVSKTTERIGFLKNPIRQLMRIACRMEGDDATAKTLETATVNFKSPLYRSDTQMADAMVKYKTLGFPLRWIAENMGMGPEEVERLMRMVEEESHDTDLEALTRSLEADNDPTGAVQPTAQPPVGDGGESNAPQLVENQ